MTDTTHLFCRLITEPIEPETWLRAVQASSDGAVASFVGVVRDHHRGRGVDHLEYHAYPEMAREEMQRIADDLRNGHAIGGLALIHRTGRLAVGDLSVLIAVAAPHRKEALAACATAIEEIKVRLPIWKKEFFNDGSEPEWVFGPDESCTGGPASAPGSGSPDA